MRHLVTYLCITVIFFFLFPIVPKLVPVTKENIANYLTYNDVDRIRILIREFVIKCLIPHCERQLRLLHEIVTNRKSRSLFSGAKRSDLCIAFDSQEKRHPQDLLLFENYMKFFSEILGEIEKSTIDS